MGPAILWGVLVIVSPSFAQQQKEHTLGDLWRKVEGYYPGIGAKQASVDASKINEAVVKTNALPQVKAQFQNSYGTYEGTSGAFFAQPGLFNVGGNARPLEGSSTVANTFGSATLDWEVFTFGKIRKEQEAAKVMYHKSLSEKDSYVLQLKKVLSERYVTLLYTNASLQWKTKNVKRLQEISQVTAGLSASGLRPAADSLLASSSFVQALGDYDQLEGAYEASLFKVQELLGEAIGRDFSLVGFYDPLIDKGNNTASIVSSHPFLHVLHQQADYLVLSEQATRKASLPSFHVLGGYSYRGTGLDPRGTADGAWLKGFSNSSTNFLAGIGLTWNLTSLQSNRLKGNQLAKESAGTKLLLSQYEQAMQADLSASQIKISKKYAQLEKSKLATKQSQAAFDMYLARYKSGLIPLSELLQIQALLEQAEKISIEVSRDYWMLLAYEAELTANFDFLFTNL